MELLYQGAATLLFILAAGALVLRWLAFCGAAVPAPFASPLPVYPGQRAERAESRRVFFAALFYRLLFALLTLLLYDLFTGSELGLADLPQLWTRWDATHYLNLARLGYGGYMEDGQNLFLVFFPLYVWLIRPAGAMLGSTAWAGLLVSWLCFAGGCVFFYALAAEEYGAKLARRGLVLLCAFPFAFFFGGIMTESLYLLTTSAALLHIRRHQWGRASLWGILAALTRMHGVLLIGAALAEWGNTARPLAAPKGERAKAVGRTLRKIPLLCLPVVGSGCYLLLNYAVTGDPFAFTRMQQHWHQGFQWFPGVIQYLLRNALHCSKLSTRWELWVPEVVLFFLTLALLLKSWRKHRSMLILYAAVSFLLTCCLSWLLSAGRYLSCNVPLFLFLAVEGNEKSTRLLTAVGFLLQVVFLMRYFSWGQVM